MKSKRKPGAPSARGGRRIGAGRPPGVPNKSTKEAHDLIDGIVDFAEIIKRWNEVATKKPLTKLGFLCGKELLDRRYGKTPQGLTLTSDNEEIGAIKVIVIDKK